ncbi:MAG: VOC family protein [Burkholderiaceae bacterium]
MNLNTARVFVRDIADAKNFYADALRLRIKVDGSEHGFCVFDAGSATLVVEAVADDAPQDDLALVGRFNGLSFDVADANAAYEELQFRGVAFTGAPEKQFWGGIVATMKDPSGNELQICQQPL